jgi:hypothetical protein
MPLKKRSKVLMIEVEDSKKNIALALEDLEINNKSVKDSLVQSGKKIELLKQTLGKL